MPVESGKIAIEIGLVFKSNRQPFADLRRATAKTQSTNQTKNENIRIPTFHLRATTGKLYVDAPHDERSAVPNWRSKGRKPRGPEPSGALKIQRNCDSREAAA